MLVFLTLGITLEGLHGFKVGWYLDASSETRRLLWTLAHAHGTLFAIIQIAFAATVSLLPHWTTSSRMFASHCIISAGILIPSGFFLGGLFVYEADAGLGILLVPAGALLLLIGVLLTACGVRSRAQGDVGSVDAFNASLEN